MKINVWKDKKINKYFCEIKDEEYPYLSVTMWGDTPEEAKDKAFETRVEILKKQLEIKPIVVDTNSDDFEFMKGDR